MSHGRWKWPLLAAGAILLAVWVYDRAQFISWVGSADLEVEFVVTEADTGRALPGARVEVRSDGGYYAERQKQEFVLLAGDDGAAGAVCRDSMSFGRRSGLGLTDTFAVHLPFWHFRVVAPGYDPGEWTELDVLEYRRQVREVGSQRARLVVPVSVRRSADERPR